MDHMSTEQPTSPQPADSKTLAVAALIDGFNLYHALDEYDRGRDEAEKTQYRKYKWLCLTSLVRRFVAPKTETLKLVEYFTTYTPWNLVKQGRHRRYVMAQLSMGVKVTFGEFKERRIRCKSDCKKEFSRWEEKQTDVNIATRLLELAQSQDFGKIILVTADSDQVPALKLAKKFSPEKVFASLVPIGRGANEIYRVCSPNYKMTEEHLKHSQLPDVLIWKSQNLEIKKPDQYK
jgi:uncharacterized LabA/DUF88 family protein